MSTVVRDDTFKRKIVACDPPPGPESVILEESVGREHRGDTIHHYDIVFVMF